MSPESRQEPELKVVDRRWWVQQGDAKVEDPATAKGEWTPGKPTYVEELERQLAERDKHLQDTVAKYREAAREFEESRARQRKDVARDVERGRRQLLVEFLDVLDNLERALDAAAKAGGADALVNGVEMVRRQFLSKLEAFGVVPIAALGEVFDPAHHEAVSVVPTADPAQDGRICGVLTAGYRIDQDVLRHATVAVWKATE
ncbi:MAG: nucleotide exchange factor GrpE [Vicinamibacterales bacterium]